MLAGEPRNKIEVERFRKTCVGNRRRQAARLEFIGGLGRLGESRAERENCDPRAFAQDAAMADFEWNALLREVDADTSPRGNRKAMGPGSCATAVATMWTSSASSAAAITVKFGRQPR